MKTILYVLSLTLLTGAIGILSASTICPATSATTSDCNYLITINSAGTPSISQVAGSSPFNSAITFPDGTGDPGADGSLIGVVNNDLQALSGFTLVGSGAGAGIFDFSFNGICAYTNASYCATAPSGYEGPTTTFGNLQSTVLFQTTEGTVTFNPGLARGNSTYFSIEDSAADINAHGGLRISNVTFGAAATPEPASLGLSALGVGGLLLIGSKLRRSV